MQDADTFSPRPPRRPPDGARCRATARLGIRRACDRCFHPVEEEVPEGFIVDGILIRHEDVTEIVRDGVRSARDK